MAIPLVSVVTAAFNAAHTIDATIDSIRNQTFNDWELVIVDDSSTDNTVDIVREHAREDPRIKLKTLDKNCGSGKSRNIALEISSAEYVAVMDADDLSLPERLAIQYELIQSHHNAAAVAGQLEEFGEWGGPIRSSWPTDPRAIRELQRLDKMPLPHPSVMFRKSKIVQVGGYDEQCRRAQDYALFLKLKNEELYCVPEVLVSYRTKRPVSLGYVVANGRYVELARARVGGSLRTTPRRLPFSTATDLRSGAQWIKRTVGEKFASNSR